MEAGFRPPVNLLLEWFIMGRKGDLSSGLRDRLTEQASLKLGSFFDWEGGGGDGDVGKSFRESFELG